MISRLCGTIRPNRAHKRQDRSTRAIISGDTLTGARDGKARSVAERARIALCELAFRAIRTLRADFTQIARLPKVCPIRARWTKHRLEAE